MSGSLIPGLGKDEFMVTGECIRKWIGISYLMVLYMGEHDTKEKANFDFFNLRIIKKNRPKIAKFSTKFETNYSITWMRRAEVPKPQEI